MENAPSLKNRITSIAAYVAAAVLLIVATIVSRKIDGAFFSSYKPFKPAEMTVEAVLILFALIYAAKHRAKGILKKAGRYAGYIVVPLLTVFAAFFCIPDRILPVSHNLIHVLDAFLSSWSDDLTLCALGCILLVHKSGLKKSGVILMLSGMALYELFLTEETEAELVFAVIAVVLIGFFEIQLHLSTESAVFCAVFHFLIRLCMELPARNTAQNGPFFGSIISNLIYFASLLIMLVSGAVLYIKRRNEELEDKAGY